MTLLLGKNISNFLNFRIHFSRWCLGWPQSLASGSPSISQSLGSPRYPLNGHHDSDGCLESWSLQHWSSPVWARTSDNGGWTNPTLPRTEDRGRYWHHQPCLDIWLLWIHGDHLYQHLGWHHHQPHHAQDQHSVHVQDVSTISWVFTFALQSQFPIFRLEAWPPVGSLLPDSGAMLPSLYFSLSQSL